MGRTQVREELAVVEDGLLDELLGLFADVERALKRHWRDVAESTGVIPWPGREGNAPSRRFSSRRTGLLSSARRLRVEPLRSKICLSWRP